MGKGLSGRALAELQIIIIIDSRGQGSVPP